MTYDTYDHMKDTIKIKWGTSATTNTFGGFSMGNSGGTGAKVTPTDMALAGIALGLDKEQVKEFAERIGQIPYDRASSAEDIYELLIKIAYEIKQETK